MPDTNRELKPALSTIDERWDTQRTERTLRALQRKRQQRTRQRRALIALGTVGACGALVFAFALRPTTSRPAVQPMAAVVQTPLHMQLADGSDVSLRDAAAKVIVDEVTSSRVALALLTGQARFDVMHREDRVFRVRCGDVIIEVLGTTFEVEREATRTRVSVLRGRVAVTWPNGRAELAAGEAGWFPRIEQPESAPTDVTSHNPKRAAHKSGVVSSVGSVAAVPRTNTWREPAEQGDFEHAYELLKNAPQPVADNVEELLLAADTARLSGHAAAALPFLKRVVAEHAHDSRAPLAAFTLGGVLMQQLGQPREAEIAYARARELSLNSSLAEDALARQVEAAYRAADTSRARALASEYLTRYPKGRRTHAVQRFGGLVP